MSLFERTIAGLYRHGMQRHSGGLRGVVGTLSWSGWMALSIAGHPMSEGHRLGALTRLVFWQFWRRMPDAGAEVTLSGGATLWCPAWSNLAGVWVSSGFHEEELLFVRDLVREGDVFVDAGANLGVYSLVAASRGARSIAIEPNPRARAALAANIELNDARDRVTLVPVALGDREGVGRMTTEFEAANRLVESDMPGTEVKLRRLDTIVEELEVIPTLVKIDVEGHDQAVLRGAEHLLEASHPILIIEVWAGGASIRAQLERYGYAFFLYRHRGGGLIPVPESFSADANLVAIHHDAIAATKTRLEYARGAKDLSPRVRWGQRPSNDVNRTNSGASP